MTERKFPSVTVTPKAERALRGGHGWVYDAEITAQSRPIENGELADVLSQKGRYLGTGFYNGASKIRVRVLSVNANDTFDDGFWYRRMKYAVDYRAAVMAPEDFRCCRLVFGEADTLPGLTVDRFEDVLSVQIACLGMEKRKDALYRALLRALEERGVTVRAICERNDLALRQKEGLERYAGFYTALPGLTEPESPVVRICENGLFYDVDVLHGQKTGFFLDQKYNRRAVAELARGKRVLDCFTNTGAFGMNAARGGAVSVTSVDISRDACEAAARHAALNGLGGVMRVECRDVFDLLTELERDGVRDYDMIILDPPAFTKSSATVKAAIAGYKQINLKAMKLLPRGGYLATCSCSHFMTEELFVKMLREAAADAAVTLRQIEARQQGRDHPILWNVPETNYLKFFLFQVV